MSSRSQERNFKYKLVPIGTQISLCVRLVLYLREQSIQTTWRDKERKYIFVHKAGTVVGKGP